jgi:hypothetical protein
MYSVLIPAQGNDNLINVINKTEFSPEECQKIIEINEEPVPPSVYYAANQGIIDPASEYPVCRYIPFLVDYSWIYERIIKTVNEANEIYYKFNISVIKSLQILEFNQNSSFNWHLDLGKGEYSTRKLSFIIFLSANDDYQGGQLKWNPELDVSIQQQGVIAMYPSFMVSKIETVTSGKAYYLLGWADGPAFC